MELSVVIPCHGGVEDTRACLRALADQQGAPAMEVLVVDNGSRDGTAQLGREFEGVHILEQGRNLGFAGGVNAGLRAARGTWLLVLNNDTMAAPQMVRRLIEGLEADARIGMAGPVSNLVKGPARIPVGSVGARPEGRAELDALLGNRGRGRLEDVETLAGLCLLFHRSLVDRIGLFDEAFGAGNFEDDDYSLRVRLTGQRLVIVRDAFLHHRGMRTFASLGLDYQGELRDRLEVFRNKWARDPAGAAHLAHREGRTAEAARWARKALGVHPSWPDAHLLLGADAADAGLHLEAIEHLRSFLSCCPLHPGAVTLLAFQMLAAGREAEGRRLLLWTLESCHLEGTDVGKILLAYGRWCLERGLQDEALLALSDAALLDPHNALVEDLLDLAQPRSTAQA